MVILPNCLLNIYILRFVPLLILVRGTSYRCRVNQRYVTVQSAENMQLGMSGHRWRISQPLHSCPEAQETSWNGKNKVRVGGWGGVRVKYWPLVMTCLLHRWASWQLWLPTQDLHKTKPVKIQYKWMGLRIQRLHLLAEKVLADTKERRGTFI